jgi:cytoskeleton protein RodZ
MSSSPFGEHLKRERELRGVSLDEIAAATRIKTSFLEALENGRWDQLPGGAFNRGFVRATAHFLGLDEDGMVAEYALETGGESQAKLMAQPSGAMPRDYRPAIMAIAALLVVIVGAAWFMHHKLSLRRQKRAEDAIAAAAASAKVPASAPETNAPQLPASAPSTPPDTTTAQTSPAAGPTPVPSPAPAATAPPPPAVPEFLKLRLETSKTSQIRVMGDGKLLFKGRLHSDDPKNFQARDGFEVTSNDPNATKLQLNGESVHFAGTTGRHGGTVSLSREDLKGSGTPSR